LSSSRCFGLVNRFSKILVFRQLSIATQKI
jgi:hypothetical protein